MLYSGLTTPNTDLDENTRDNKVFNERTTTV
jgi:hypothetical protein